MFVVVKCSSCYEQMVALSYLHNSRLKAYFWHPNELHDIHTHLKYSQDLDDSYVQIYLIIYKSIHNNWL